MYAVKKPRRLKVLAEAKMQLNTLDTSEIHRLKLSFFEFFSFLSHTEKKLFLPSIVTKRKEHSFETKDC